MKKQFITSILISFLIFFGFHPKVYAVLLSEQSPQMSQNQRDKYQTDLFTGSSSYSYPIKVPKRTNNLTLFYLPDGDHKYYGE